MKKNVFILIIIGLILIFGFFIVKGSGKSNNTSTEILRSSSVSPTIIPQISIIPADKIEVVHFHATQQCPSCIAVGKFALQTIQQSFAEEYKSGVIVFKEINVELPENQDIVMKYQARGSSLFINAIRGDKDDIVEDLAVWRLVNNESQYISYFEGKLKSLLGK